MSRRTRHFVREPTKAPRKYASKKVTLQISARDARLVAEQGASLVDSFRCPGEREDRQDPHYHEGKELVRLAAKMRAALKRAGRKS